jgi:hypothetical protein
VDAESKQLDRRRFKLEVLGVTAQILGVFGLVFAGFGLLVSRDAVEASNRQLEISNRQLSESKYESVYQHQLDLWSLAAQNESIAPYIVGGRLPESLEDDNAPPPSSSTETENQRAAIAAALYQALDFYAYVFAQLAPRDDEGNPPPNVLDASTTEDRPDFIDRSEWATWSTWAATIVQGFEAAPGMCEYLYERTGEDGSYAYEEAFRTAVGKSVPDCVR